MANGVTTDTRNWDRAHSDIEVVKQRMTSLEAAFTGFSTQLQDIGKRLDTKPTDVWKIIGGVVTVISLVGGFLLVGKQPYDDGLARHDREISQHSVEISRLAETALSKEDFKAELDLQQRRNLAMEAATAKTNDELTLTRIELAKLEGASAERHEEYLRDHADLVATVRTLDANLIKRPEIESGLAALRELYTLAITNLNGRTDAVIGSLNELRRDFGANWTIGDTVRAIEVRLNALQLQPGFLPTPAPPK